LILVEVIMDDLIREFDAIIEEAPVDFLGTGSNSRWANKCEREWYERCEEFKKKLIVLSEKFAG
jgi:hypothetical protein